MPCKAVFHRGLRRNPCLMLCAARFVGPESLGRPLLVPALDRVLMLTRLCMQRLMRLSAATITERPALAIRAGIQLARSA